MATKEDFQKASTRVIVFSPCSGSKCDKPTELPQNFKFVAPANYLESDELIERLKSTRNHILENLGARKGAKPTLAFDLYVRAGIAYKGIFQSCYNSLRNKLLHDNNIQWFFISGGYGVVSALEVVNDYQATFDRSIAHNKRIPFTYDKWQDGELLTQLCDAIVRKHEPNRVYVFGSKQYTWFVRNACFWEAHKADNKFKMFKSVKSNGPNCLSPIINELAEDILHNTLDTFDCKYAEKYPTFQKEDGSCLR